MRYLSSTLVLLVFVLASCANAPSNIQQNTPAATVSTQTSSENSIAIVGGNDEALREFIRQWAIPYQAGSSQATTIYIGSTPDDIPYDLPTPDDSNIIGSVTGGWIDYLLIFNTNLTAEAVQEFYAQSLVDSGWKEAPMSSGGGFTSQPDFYKGYCYGENEAFLGVEAPSIPGETTSIRLSLDTSADPHMCNADPNYGSLYVNVIPELHAPKGVSVQGTGAGSSDRDAHVSANLKGNLTAAEAADFYNEQLSAAGWEMQNASQGEGAAWSQWRFEDEQGTHWIGALMVVELPAESNSLYALMTIEKNK